jgi:hypothetical protein
MSRFYKSIRVFFLLLAGLAISAHMIILHDHHLSDPIIGQKDSCSAADGKSGHHTGLPVHCHVFNDLAAEKLSSLVLKKYIHSGFSTIIWFPDYSVNELHVALITVFGTRKPFPDIYIPDYSPFRGPPSVS